MKVEHGMATSCGIGQYDVQALRDLIRYEWEEPFSFLMMHMLTSNIGNNLAMWHSSNHYEMLRNIFFHRSDRYFWKWSQLIASNYQDNFIGRAQ